MTTSHSPEAAVRAVEAAYDAAWRAGDLDGLVACLTADAVLVNPRGETVRGHAAIRRELEAVLHGPARGSVHTTTIAGVEFLTQDVAVVDGVARIERGDDDASVLELTHRFTDILVRRGGRWRIAHVRACPPNPSSAPFP